MMLIVCVIVLIGLGCCGLLGLALAVTSRRSASIHERHYRERGGGT